MATMNYDKLWKLLIDKKMMKKDLIEKLEFPRMLWQRWEKAEMFLLMCFERYAWLWIVSWMTL